MSYRPILQWNMGYKKHPQANGFGLYKISTWSSVYRVSKLVFLRLRSLPFRE